MTRCLTAAAMVLFASVAFAAADDDRVVQDLVKAMTPPADSKQFAMKAGECGLMEVKLAELAQQKAQSQEVKQLAQRIREDHQKANDQLKQVAQSKQIDLPSDLTGLKAAQFKAFQQLEGKTFENNYVLHMVKAHLGDIMMFQNEAQNGTDQEIKQWATQTLPHLKHHAKQVTQVAQGIGVPIEVIAMGGAAGDTARPAGARTTPGTGAGTGTSTERQPDRNRDR